MNNSLFNLEIKYQRVCVTTGKNFIQQSKVKFRAGVMVRDIATAREVFGSISEAVKSNSVANDPPPLRSFCVVQALSRGDGSCHSLQTSDDNASIMKI